MSASTRTPDGSPDPTVRRDWATGQRPPGRAEWWGHAHRTHLAVDQTTAGATKTDIIKDGLLSELGPLLAVVVPHARRTDMHLMGELDVHTAPILHTLLEQQIATGHWDVALDLSGLAFCDVRGLHALVRGRRRLDALGGQLVLLRPPPLLVQIAGLCGLLTELGFPVDRRGKRRIRVATTRNGGAAPTA